MLGTVPGEKIQKVHGNSRNIAPRTNGSCSPSQSVPEKWVEMWRWCISSGVNSIGLAA